MAYVNTEDWEIRLLAVGHTDIARVSVHEFAHLVTAKLNKDIPRWLWESIAIYEAEEKIEDGKSISCITHTSYPTLDELNASHTTSAVKVYRIGYSLIEYVVEVFGRDSLIDLISNDGNVQESLGVAEADFENGWHQFVLSRYDIVDVGAAMNKDQLEANMNGKTFTNDNDAYAFTLNADNSMDFSSALTTRFFGLPDTPNKKGTWEASNEGKLCVSSPDFDQSTCTPWYLTARETFRQTISSDCKWFNWHRTK
ncbi:MAG: hypothetical protein GKR90_14330 [Pseudomonadales bacterium]|nr:hypothetical protein [Pseudomonadales bacterium]